MIVYTTQQIKEYRQKCFVHLAACNSPESMVIYYTTEGEKPTEFKKRGKRT